MKRKVLTLCAVVSVCGVLMACGDSAKVEAVTGVQEEQITEAPAAEASVETATEADVVVEETAQSADEEGKYVVFTDASNAEVEAFAKEVVDATLAKDWNKIADMIEYPIGSDDLENKCNNKEEFLAYANDKGFDEAYFTTLSAWDINDLWGNYQGACIDDGNIWFRDVDVEKKEFKIVSFLGLPEGSLE